MSEWGLREEEGFAFKFVLNPDISYVALFDMAFVLCSP